MKRRIILRADAGKEIGYGHFIRSLALAEYLRDDFDCYFASFNPDELLREGTSYQSSEISKVCHYLDITANNLKDFNKKFIQQIRPDDIVVLDNYYFTTDYQQKIKNLSYKLVCIDDMNNRHFICDMLMTPSPFVRDDFSIEAYTEFIGGIQWAFLRKPFLEEPVIKREWSTDIKSIIIGMGGSDAFNLTDKIVSIANTLLPNSQINVICGNSVEVSQHTQSVAQIHRRISANDIVKLFDNSDIGIFPASTICIEAFSRKLPVIAGYYAENQHTFYNYGVNNNLFAPLGNLLDDEINEIKQKLAKTLYTDRPHPINIDFKLCKSEIINKFKTL